jgi:Tol biopolymer transport system component
MWGAPFALSPDGRVLAYAGGGLWIRTLDEVDPLVVPGTEGANMPFFSPDGRWIGFFQGGTLKRVPATGELPTTVGGTTGDGIVAANWGATWRNDSTIIFVGDGVRFWEAPVGEGAPRPVTEFSDGANEMAHAWPQAFDGGRLVVYTVVGPSGLWHDASVVVQDLETGERMTVAEGATCGRYVATGHIIYADASGTLSAVPFDSREREVTGPAIPVESGVRVSSTGGAAAYATSEGGTLAFVRGSPWENHVLAWFDREGRRIGEVGAPVTTASPRLSPDGRQVSSYLARPANSDLYVIDVESGLETRVTFDPGSEDTPVWSPDGRRLAYTSAKNTSDVRIEIKEIESNAPPEQIYSSRGGWVWPSSWSSDGRWLLFSQHQPGGDLGIGAIQVDSAEHVIPVAVTEYDETSAQFSPDGDWVAYQSNETGRSEVYVGSFPDLLGKRQVSTEGGGRPVWSEGGDELFFWQGSTLMVSRVSTPDGVFRREPPQSLFDVPDQGGSYGVTPDGERLLVKIGNPEARIGEIQVVLNWLEVLRAQEGT